MGKKLRMLPTFLTRGSEQDNRYYDRKVIFEEKMPTIFSEFLKDN